MYHRTPEWVQLNMGEENALQAIHQKLSAQQAVEKVLAERILIEEIPQGEAMETATNQERPAVSAYADMGELRPELTAEMDHIYKPDAVSATLPKAKSAAFPEKEKIMSNKPAMPVPKINPVSKKGSSDVTKYPEQDKSTALETGTGLQEKPTASASKKTVVMPTAKTNVLKQIKTDPVDYVEARGRVTAFLNKFTYAYEQKDLSRFQSFFADGALEQGKRFEKMLPTYRKTFSLVEVLRYHIYMQSFTVDNTAKSIVVNGAFTASYRLPEKDWGSSSGTIRLVLLDTSRGLLVSKLNYEME
jgi:hypothetical protein